MDVILSEETQVLRENYRVGNGVKVTETSSSTSVPPDGGDVTYWRKEYDKARLSESQARSDANTFLQCYSELEDVAQKAQTEKQGIQKKLQALEYQLEAAQREVEKWKSEYEALNEEKTANFEPKCFVDCSVQVWETEFEKCDFSLFASTVDTSQQTDALDVSDDEDSNKTTEEIRDVLGSCIQQVRDATCTLLEAQEKDKAAIASNKRSQDLDQAEDKTKSALQWEHSQIQLSIEQMQKQEHELRNTLRLLIDEVESTKKTYEEIQLDHNRYLHDIDARFRKHTSELDEIARIADRYATTAEAQKSRAEFFKAKADEQKQILMKPVQKTQKSIPENINSSNLSTGQKYLTELSDKSTGAEITDHFLRADPQKLELFLYKQQQLMYEKDAEVYYWKSQSRKTQLKEISNSIRGPGIANLLDDAAGDLEVIEAEILTAVEKRTGIASELTELSLQKQQTRDKIKELEESRTTLEASIQIVSVELEKKRTLLKSGKSDIFKLKEDIDASKSEAEILEQNLKQKKDRLKALETEIEAKKSSLQNEIQQHIAAKHEADCAQEDARQKQAKLEILTKELNDQERLLQANKQRLDKESSLLEERRVSQLDIEKMRTTIEEEKCKLQALHIQKAELLQSIDDLDQRHPKEEDEKQLTEKRKVISMSDVAIQCCLKRNEAKLCSFIPKRPTVSYSNSNESVSSESACSTQGNDSVERPTKTMHNHPKAATAKQNPKQTFELEGEEIYNRLRSLVRLIREASKEYDRCLITKAFRESVSLIHELCQLYTEAKTKIHSLWKTIENGTKRMKAIEQQLSFVSEKT